jgi:TolA-binding protein
LIGLSRNTVLLLALAASPALPGCFWFTSARAGDEMRADLDSLRTDVDTMRESFEVERQRFEGLFQEATRQVEELQAVLQRTTDVLTRNSADFGQEFADLSDEVRRIRGRLDEVLAATRESQAASAAQTRRIDRIERAVGLDPEIDEAEAPATPEELFQKASDLLAAGSYGVARAWFRLFVSRYPDDAKAVAARVEIGVAYSMEGRHEDAVATLSEVAQRWPDAPENDRVFFYTATSLHALGRCEDAQVLLRQMLRKYPESPLKAQAEQLQLQIRATPGCR